MIKRTIRIEPVACVYVCVLMFVLLLNMYGIIMPSASMYLMSDPICIGKKTLTTHVYHMPVQYL